MFNLQTDASNFILGAVLSQNDENGDMRPLTFTSRKLNSAEQKYATIEKELLAIVWATKQFYPYLVGQKFKIMSDHKPLIWAFKIKDPTSSLTRWRFKLAKYDCEIEHISGKNNTIADALSRIGKLTTRSCHPSTKPRTEFEHRPMISAKRIILLTSIDKIKQNPHFSAIQLEITEKGQIQRCTLKHKIVYKFVFGQKPNLPTETEENNLT